MQDFDFAIVGAGIAGVSAAYHLAPHARVIVLEREHVAAYHTTGRSAALHSETYGKRGDPRHHRVVGPLLSQAAPGLSPTIPCSRRAAR